MRIRSVTVGAGSAEAVVVFEDGEPLRTADAPLARERLLRVAPGLRGHSCDNDRDARFSDELADTEVAHAIEHVALEVMVLAGSPDRLRGETSWDFACDGRGVFRVRLDYDDDLVCVGALRVACAAVRWAMDDPGAGDAPDVAAEAASLAELRRWPVAHEAPPSAI